MGSRKLLILTMYFPPCAAVATHRMVGLVRYLPQYDWETIVVAPPNVFDEPTDPDLMSFIPTNETTIYSVPFSEGFIGKIQRKLDPTFFWERRAIRACKNAILKHKPDAILTSLPPVCMHQLGIRITKSFKLPWIADFRDPWFEQDSGILEKIKGHSAGVSDIINSSKYVVSTSPAYTKLLQTDYPDRANNIITITNGFDSTNFKDNLTPPVRDRLSLLYTGELYFKRNPLGLLDALSEIESSSLSHKIKLQFDFIGRFHINDYNLPAEVKSRGLEHMVNIHGFKPYKECLQETSLADIAVLIQTEGYIGSIPAKIFDYIGARRPILVLANPPGDLEWVLKKSGILYRIAPVRDTQKIKQAIMEIVTELQANRPIFNPQSDRIPFTREDMARQFADILNKAVS